MIHIGVEVDNLYFFSCVEPLKMKTIIILSFDTHSLGNTPAYY
jgi:hypothetical protein